MEAKDCHQVKCFRCHKIGHSVKECQSEVKCNVCEETGHSFRDCKVSFANKIKPAPMKWITEEEQPNCNDNVVSDTREEGKESPSGATSKAVITDGDGVQPDGDAGVVNCSRTVVMVTQSGSSAEMVTTDGGEVSMVEDSWAQDMGISQFQNVLNGSQCESSMEIQKESSGEVFLSDLGISQSEGTVNVPVVNDNQSQGDLFDDQVAPMASQQSSMPDLGFNDKEISTAKDRAGRVRASRGTSLSIKKDRSRSRRRFPPEEPLDTVKMTQIFIEEEPWHSCHAKGCSATFSSFNVLMDHTAKDHPDLEAATYPCVLKNSCDSFFSTPRDWIHHIASKHPNFVKKHDLEFFDGFFFEALIHDDGIIFIFPYCGEYNLFKFKCCIL